MKLFIISILSITSLFAGGEIPAYDVAEYEQTHEPVDTPKYKKMAVGYIKPKCEDCGEPAKLLPYNGEDLPEAETYPCPKVDEKGCIHHIS